MRVGEKTVKSDGTIARSGLGRLAARQILPLGLTATLIWLLWDRLAALDLSGLSQGLGAIGALNWALALGLSGLSFWAVGRYDGVAHRMLGTGVTPGAALTSGAAAIAVAQSVGLGVVSGALVRWRMLPGLSLMAALRLSALVAMSFIVGWSVVSAAVLTTVPGVLAVPTFLPPALLAAAAALAALSLWRPGPLARLPLPPLGAMAAFVGLAALDTFAAGAALWVLMPAGAAPPFAIFLAAYLIALGAGLIGGTPGGMGPFEVTLVALLPATSEPALLGAVLAFRGVYYAVPALIGAGLAIRGPRPERPAETGARLAVPDAATLSGLIAHAPRAEAALLRHGRLALLARPDAPETGVMAARTPQCLIQLSDPLAARAAPRESLRQLAQAARAQARTPALYKVGARQAVAARRDGWRVVPVAREAWLTPRSYTGEGRAFRQLRRKLNKARSAGVRIEHVTPDAASLSQMRRVAQEWARARGGERGFSMGVFDPDTLPHARVFLAWQGERLVGFLTLHGNAREWTLDLMRYSQDAPDGTMHLALDAAIRSAAQQGLARLSLAAVPTGGVAGEAAWAAKLRSHFDRATGATGLHQFKAAFAPHWETLYFAAPHLSGLLLAAIDLAREIARPERP